jgi:hypothetical protein
MKNRYTLLVVCAEQGHFVIMESMAVISSNFKKGIQHTFTIPLHHFYHRAHGRTIQQKLSRAKHVIHKCIITKRYLKISPDLKERINFKLRPFFEILQRRHFIIHNKNTAMRNKKPLIYGTADITSSHPVLLWKNPWPIDLAETKLNPVNYMHRW